MLDEGLDLGRLVESLGGKARQRERKQNAREHPTPGGGACVPPGSRRLPGIGRRIEGAPAGARILRPFPHARALEGMRSPQSNSPLVPFSRKAGGDGC